MAKKIRQIEKLPAVNQTDVLKKFFAATVDQVFQPQSVEFISGYIGQKPSYYNPLKDFYINEPEKSRQDYQLEPIGVSQDAQTGELTNTLFYQDIVNYLRYQGANVENHSRLFDQEYYSWCPPLDLDKFVNFGKYFWLPKGPQPITLFDQTDLSNLAVGQKQYTYVGMYQLQSDTNPKYGQIKFTTGLKIQVTNDLNIDLNGLNFVVNGVGQSIQLIDDSQFDAIGWDNNPWDLFGWGGTDSYDSPDYVVMERGATDKNAWSRADRWFHQDVVLLSGASLSESLANKAQRPIICFNQNMELFNSGFVARPDVDVVDDSTVDVFATIRGSLDAIVDGIELQAGMRLLVKADSDPLINNRVYLVSRTPISGWDQTPWESSSWDSGTASIITLSLELDGQNGDGSPSYGEQFKVNFGNTYGNKYLWFDGNNWIFAQQKTKTNQAPLFALYDTNATRLDDQGVYPQSNFQGNTVFEYLIDQTSSILDSVLGLKLTYNSFGNIVFNQSIATITYNYFDGSQTQDIIGYYFYRQRSRDLTSSIWSNNWHKSSTPSRQYVVDQFTANQNQTTFKISQVPAENITNQLPTLFVFVNSVLKKSSVDYVLTNNSLVFATGLNKDDQVNVYSWTANNLARNATGFYQIPLNLQANPNQTQITQISSNEWYDHFNELLAYQTSFEGQPFGINNWRDTAKVPSLGLHILQHRAPMLKLMGLASASRNQNITSPNSDIDIMFAMRYAQREYVRFYNKLIRKFYDLYEKQGWTQAYTPDQWIDQALGEINVGKTKENPWVNSGPSSTQGEYCSAQSQNPTFVPPTPSRLGVMPVYLPKAYFDNTLNGANLVVQCHDGSIIVLADLNGVQLGTISNNLQETTNPLDLSNPISSAILQFENNLYASIPSQYKQVESRPVLDIRLFVSNKWNTQDYSEIEYLNILRPMFNRWTVLNQVDFRTNSGFDINDAFSWNWSTTVDIDGNPLPGNWRNIYKRFYGTDRPHTCPWEMLGFTQKPTWWDSEYGLPPYTSGNTHMWEDLRDGKIVQGPLSGTYREWARPNLLRMIPVDQVGNLLDPSASGIARSIPSVADAQMNWKFGDGAPVETAWYRSFDGQFSLAQALYLMKPARFVEYCWDATRTEHIYKDTVSSQWIYTDTKTRKASSQFYVHRENPSLVQVTNPIIGESDLDYFGSCGIQHWISEYVISNAQNVTTKFGNIIRGLDTRLGHKLAGFIDGTTVRVIADSFGNLNPTTNILLPQEDMQTLLYKGTSTGEFFYGGVIVEKQANGWAVIGYDVVNPFFEIIPSDPAGPKTSVVIGNQSVVEYKIGKKQTLIVPYNTVFETRQQVYDFLISWGRYLNSQNWLLDDHNFENNEVYNWTLSAKEFLFWSQGNWQNGNFIALSPGATKIKFKKTQGTVQSIEQIISGSYSILDKAGQPISPKNVAVSRLDDEVAITPLNDQGIYGVRLYTNDIEHVIIFNNRTVFNDLIYDPLYSLRQNRLRLYTYRTTNWNGRVDAQGYLVTDNGLITNFEKTVNDFRNYYGIEPSRPYQLVGQPVEYSQNTVVDRDILLNEARHLVGYQSRAYLQNLLLDNTIQFQFYQGLIKGKGTPNTLTRLFRNTDLFENTQNFIAYEEWAFRVGRYGGIAAKPSIDIIVPASQYKNNPQLIEFFSTQSFDYSLDDVIDIVPNDPRIVVTPETYDNTLFPLRDFYGPRSGYDLPTAGYVKLGEVDHLVVDQTQLLSLYDDLKNTTSPLSLHQTVWQFIDPVGDWTVWMVTDTGLAIFATVPGEQIGDNTKILFATPHGLSSTDLVILFGIIGEQPEIDSTFPISFSSNNDELDTIYVTNGGSGYTGVPMIGFVGGGGAGAAATATVENGVVTKITVTSKGAGYTTAPGITFAGGGGLGAAATGFLGSQVFEIAKSTSVPGLGGSVWLYHSNRFENNFQRDLVANIPTDGWRNGDYVWVDDGEISGAWSTYERSGSTWNLIRNENFKVDSRKVDKSRLYDKLSLRTLSLVNYFDPVKGVIPSIADVEISYKTDYDPAKYNNGDSTLYQIDPDQAWGLSQEGQVWWDLSTVRYLDYEISDDRYRWRNWGKLAPGTTVDIYEWVRSPVPPASWDSYVTQAATSDEISPDNKPTGVVRNADNPAWVEVQEIDQQSGAFVTFYYFWVKNKTTVPAKPFRKLSTSIIASIITDPTSNNISWFGIISQTGVVTANIDQFLDGNNTVMQLFYLDTLKDLNIHQQWLLMRPDDPFSVVNDLLYNKMHDSLVGFDGLGKTVPDPKLNELEAYGTLIRPRQTWFQNQSMARRIFVDATNSILANASAPPVDDINRQGWLTYFTKSDPLPDSSQYDQLVSDLSARNALVGSIPVGFKVLVEFTGGYNNWWTLWQFNGITSDPQWTLLQIQSYNTNDYWNYSTWYATGYSSSNIPTQTFATILDRDQGGPFSDGQLIQVNNDGSGKFVWYEYNGSSFDLVAKQDGTIQLSSLLYDQTANSFGFANSNFDSLSFEKDANQEMSWIIQGCRNALLLNSLAEQNKVFFALINYVHTEQRFVDWVFKTSYIVLGGISSELKENAFVEFDNTQSFLDYVEEAKPYHVKVREFVQTKTKFEQADIHVTDFDRPPYASNDGTYRILQSPADNAILENAPYDAWYNNYILNPSLIRQITTKMYFDRVSCSLDQGALARINQYYTPTPYMPEKSPSLISGCDYRGIIVDGFVFGLDAGWDQMPFDTFVGWSPTTEQLTGAYDILLQGGLAPQYISYYGNTVKTVYTLGTTPSVASEVKIWVNNALLEYNVDYTIPVIPGTEVHFVSAPGFPVSGIPNIMILLPDNTFQEAPINASDIIVDGGMLVQPLYDSDRPEELALQRVQNSIRIDTYSIDSGGAPLVLAAVYQSDGIRDHFAMKQSPMNSDAVFVYLNGVKQKYGLAYDYVINFDTNQVVFIWAPPPGIVKVVTISTGGGAIGVQSVRIVAPGTNYSVNDIITVAGGTYSSQAKLRVNYVRGVLLSITNGGNGYAVNDLIYLNGGNYQSQLIAKVSSIAPGGTVTGLTITNGGTYDLIPNQQLNQWTTAGSGNNLQTDITWGVRRVERYDDGQYSVKPANPILQDSVTPAGGTGVQMVIEWGSARQLKILGTFEYQGDGIVDVFSIYPLEPSSASYVLCTVEGIEVVPLSIVGSNVTLAAAPGPGENVVLTVFNTPVFSRVAQEFFTYQWWPPIPPATYPGDYTYVLSSIAASTIPDYATTIVRKNGQLMQPPDIEYYIGNGATVAYALTYTPSGASSVSVWIDDVVKTNPVDWSLVGSTVVFTVAPTFNSLIKIMVADSTLQNYDYLLSGNTIILQTWSVTNGDEISVTTFTEDTTYQMRTETYLGALDGIYPLSQVPFNDSSVWVSINGLTQSLIWDYLVTQTQVDDGWDKYSAWDSAGWDNLLATVNAVVFGVGQSPSDEVVITTISGLPERPPTAFRLFQDATLPEYVGLGWDQNAWDLYGWGITVIESAMTKVGTRISDANKTYLVNDVLYNSTEILVEDTSVLATPLPTVPGIVWINDEQIAYYGIVPSPTGLLPNRGYLSTLIRGIGGTPNGVPARYDFYAYNGDGTSTAFLIPGGPGPLATFCEVDGIRLSESVDYSVVGPNIIFNVAPSVGVANVRINSLQNDWTSSSICHLATTVVVDGSKNQNIPGNYTWEPAPNGLQYSSSLQAKFLLAQPGTL